MHPEIGTNRVFNDKHWLLGPRWGGEVVGEGKT